MALQHSCRQGEIGHCHLALMGILLILLSACTIPKSSDPEALFQTQIGVKIDPQVILDTNRLKYDQKTPIAIGIFNRKTKPIYFPDQDLGLRIYKFDSNTQTWMELKRRSVLGNPSPVTVPPRSPNPFPSGGIGLLEIPSTGMVRLVAIGWDDPNNPDGSRFATFTDVEITNQ